MNLLQTDVPNLLAAQNSSQAIKLPDLLAPAGNWECAKAAVANGADAIYFGLDWFNARMRSENFTEADLPLPDGAWRPLSVVSWIPTRPDVCLTVGQYSLAQDRNPLARIPIAPKSLKASASRPRCSFFRLASGGGS